MNTLNYWLGKLNRLQLFGHGVQPVVVREYFEGGYNEWIIEEVITEDGMTVIKLGED